eukprot:TRINITY_DN2967_c3_g3_i1.p2 TRINITY_DN2967_c3_g3~~TRINITY_DN2967_c3_g3_i1.p2  ORF type:complete len:126 (-),score=52.25 TRINITY_DN2967_c3_g3_i1:197-574(-)
MAQHQRGAHVCNWHAALLSKVSSRRGNVQEVLSLCQAEQSFWSSIHVEQSQMTCLEHRRAYASAWNGAKLLLTEFDARDATGQRVITRTPLFKSLLEDMLQRGPAAAAAAPGEASAAVHIRAAVV